MGETETHQRQMIELLQALKRRYSGRDVWVGGNVLLCYDRADRNRHVCPDVMVVFGVEPRLRDNYLLFEEKAVPAVVFEITSKSTRREDMRVKKDLYLELGVREYYMFDPTQDYLRPPLQGWHARGGVWVRLHGEPMRSEALDLELRTVDGALRLYDRLTGNLLLTDAEMIDVERRRADDEQQRADAARRQLDEERRARQRAEDLNTQLLHRIAELEKANPD